METSRIYAGHHGPSVFEDIKIPFLTGESRSLPFLPATGMHFRYSGEEYSNTWHNAPRRQLLIVLSGILEITSGDGTTKNLRSGDMVLADDLTGGGHVTRTHGECIRASIVMPEWAPTPGLPDLPTTPPINPGDKMRRGQAIRMYAGEDHESHFEDLSGLYLEADTARNGPLIPVTGVQFLRSPESLERDWRPAPRRQFVIVLSGEMELEIGDGSKRLLSAGDVMLAEDVSGHGHIVRSRGDRRIIFVALEENAMVRP